MFQKFNSDTLMGRFVKGMLSKEPTPLLDCVKDGDILIEGCLYIYKHFVLKCETSGKLFVSPREELFPSDTLYPSITLLPNLGYIPATFKVVSHFDESIAESYMYRYKSNVHWYDSETHKHLGNYLRYLRDNKNLDLMPYYNCYNSYELSDIYLRNPKQQALYPSESLFSDYTLYPRSSKSNRSSYVLGKHDGYRVIAIPIKFGKLYTIALDCPSTLQLRCVIYGKSGMVRIPNTDNKYYSDMLEDTYRSMVYSQFNKPFIYSVETLDKQLYQLQNCLYLLIQVPSTCNSTLTVLEGNYLTNSNAIQTTTNYVRKYELFENLSLLAYNSKETYAFSDRLVEYLLMNVIHSGEEIPGNIRTYQKLLYANDPFYRSLVSSGSVSIGVWDEGIRRSVLRLIRDNEKKLSFSDQDGYINKDVEELIHKLGTRGG